MSIKKNYFYNMLLTVTNLLAPLITTPYVLRMLGPEGIGRVNFAMSLMGFFLMVAQTGFNYYAIKEIAKVRDDHDSLNKKFSELFAVNSVISAAALILYMTTVISVQKFRVDAVLFAIVGINIAVNMFSIDWFYGGMEEYKYISLRSLAVKAAYVAVIFIIIRTQNDCVKYACMGVGVIVAGNIINMIYVFKKTSISFSGLDLKKHFRPIGNMAIVGATAGIANRLDAVLLGYMTGPKYVGYYTTSRSITAIAITFIGALGTVLIPRLSYYLNNDMKKEYNEIAEKSLNFIYFAAFPIMTMIIVLGDEIMLLFGGGKFLPASISLKILALYILINSVSAFLCYQVIMPNNDEKLITIAAIPALLVDVIINIVFIKNFLHAAPSAAIVVAEAVSVILMYILARKYITFKIFKKQSVNYMLASVLLGAVIYLIKTLFGAHHFYFAFICPPVFVVAYLCYLFLVKDENVNIILDLILKKLRRN